jgi:hypothetical protein
MLISFLRSRALLAVVACALNHAAIAAGSFVTLLGGDPGSPLTHSYSYGLPQNAGENYTLRIPANAQVLSVFYDTVLTISAPEKIIQQVSGSRAFTTFEDCKQARNILLAQIAERMPQSYTQEDEKWQFQSADGKIVARAVCEKPRHYPRPVLHMLIALQP